MIKRNFYHPRNRKTSEISPPTISLPFNNFVQKLLVPIFKAQGCRVVNYASNTIRSNLVKNRPPDGDNRRDAPCVYKIPCNTCSQAYYGETGRGIATRLGEHEAYVRHNNHSKAVTRHKNQDPNHDINFEGAQALYHSDLWYNRLVIESTCILTQSNFNLQSSTLAIDDLAAQILTRAHPHIFNPP